MLAVLGAGTAPIRRSVPVCLGSEPLRSKLDHLARHPNSCDALSLGSSHVHRRTQPAVFDAVAVGLGRPTRSFNLGVHGMQGLQTEFVLEQVLALERRNLRWVWIDPGEPPRDVPVGTRNFEPSRT